MLWKYFENKCSGVNSSGGAVTRTPLEAFTPQDKSVIMQNQEFSCQIT